MPIIMPESEPAARAYQSPHPANSAPVDRGGPVLPGPPGHVPKERLAEQQPVRDAGRRPRAAVIGHTAIVAEHIVFVWPKATLSADAVAADSGVVHVRMTGLRPACRFPVDEHFPIANLDRFTWQANHALEQRPVRPVHGTAHDHFPPARPAPFED